MVQNGDPLYSSMILISFHTLCILAVRFSCTTVPCPRKPTSDFIPSFFLFQPFAECPPLSLSPTFSFHLHCHNPKWSKNAKYYVKKDHQTICLLALEYTVFADECDWICVMSDSRLNQLPLRIYYLNHLHPLHVYSISCLTEVHPDSISTPSFPTVPDTSFSFFCLPS